MELKFSFDLKQSQQLNITPQLQMAIRLLQYSTLGVKEYLEEMLKENPLLEIIDKDGPKVDLNYFHSNNDFNYENMIVKEKQLNEHLNEQLFQYFSESEIKIARYIIGNLDDKGFFNLEAEFVAGIFEVSKQEVKKIIKKIQKLDPPGVAAKNFQESLQVQLDMLAEETELAQIIVGEYLSELAEGNFKVIANNLNVSKLKIEEAVQLVKTLNPYPASGFYQGNDTKYLFPDLIIKEAEGDLVLVNNSILPEVKINNYYYKLLKKSSNSEELNYLKERYKAASWLIKSIEQRQKTIYKIGTAIIEKQKAFLKKGIKSLYPMTLKDIAKVTNVHESTVSRAAKEKYIQTPQGLFELNFFFNSGIGKFSSPSIKSYIADFIKEEDPKDPLSDSKISLLFSRRLGINISRRTIAKYRTEMSLLSSNKRKKTI